MKIKSLILMSVISVITWTLATQSAQAETRLAIHATQAEMDIWKQRRLNGPYLDDWNRILNRANSFRSNPTGTWPGNQVNAAWGGDAVRDGNQPPNFYPDRTLASSMRDAGFVYLMTGDTSYRDPVRAKLLAQAAIPGTNFTNTTKWPGTYVNQDKDFEITLWLREITYAYSYIRDSLSAGDKSTIDAWLLGAGTYWDLVVHNSAKNRFANRWTSPDDFTTTRGASGCWECGLTHFGGYRTYDFGYAWSNKASQHNAAVAGIAVVIDNATLKAHAKRFVKEWLHANVYANGTVWEQTRWNQGTAQAGWTYAMAVIGSNVTAVDHLARDGDTELYTYSTSGGVHGSSGGPKSLLLVLQRIANLTLNNQRAYASNTSTTDPSLLIDPNGTKSYVHDVALAQANVFYQDALLKTCYTRPMPSNPDYGGYDPWGGDWGNLPGARFMFGQMEGKVWPYPTTSTLAAPTNLKLIE
jgi:hypothetical protein